jgi:hypothetical protein
LFVKGYQATLSLWGCSSIGRAPALQEGGRRFDPVQLHHILSRSINFLIITESKLWQYQKVK